MYDRLVKDLMKQESALTLSPETCVSTAAKLMAERKLGAAMVVEGEVLVGIFTERDALFRVIACGLNADTTQLAQVMTRSPLTVDPKTTYGYALVMMQENGFRHAPVVDNGKPVGIVSARSAMDPELEEFVSESNRRQYIRQHH